MNIFYIDKDPMLAAQGLMDVHVRKMILESCQLLMTHDTLNGLQRPYLPTHVMHPCRVSLRNVNNYTWLCIYLGRLCEEFRYRFARPHACEEHFLAFYANHGALTSDPTFPQCMPDEFMCNDTVEAYRAYYRAKRFDFMLNGIAQYTKRHEPYWM